MSEKSDKLRAMLEKEKERRIKLNNRIEILERRIQEEDSAEVNEVEQLSEAEVKAAEEEAALEEKNEVIIENDEPDDEEE